MRWYNFHNDPSNDAWDGSRSESAHLHCAELLADRAPATLAPFDHSAWLGAHANDCNYQKFLIFLRQAIRYGMTTETVELANVGSKTVTSTRSEKPPEVPKPPALKEKPPEAPKTPALKASPGDAAAAASSVHQASPSETPKTPVVVETPKATGLMLSDLKSETKLDVKYASEVRICFDAAIAQEYGQKVLPAATCEFKKRTTRRPRFVYEGNVNAVEPILRSPYSVLQYFGRLLADESAYRVGLIDAGTPRMPTGDDKIFTVTTKVGEGDCFASVYHDEVRYCVPNKGANNTKEVFVLLNTLINMSTKREALPSTPTVQVLQ